ncbi:MAG: hypothetical protein H8D87_02495 [Deltaproteobacteria bacterium]|uniref:hypothetical protein n=1 Tax=Desulfobacula sp. TaxID=2593537 RepID=UPI00199DE84D|nr:hypothetical protein [Candidatus Desulfobacula maris]MBL6993110.1 hypothetical protein [Desulfobacula sp.]
MILTDLKSHASAFGVAACVGLLLYLLSLTGNDPNKTEQTATSSPSVVQEGGSEYLTPSEIIAKLKAIATPSLREKAAQGYVGSKVEWNLYLKNIITQKENDVHAVFTDTIDFPHNALVSCVVSLNDNKSLKVIEEGMLFNVLGQISKIDPNNESIELENVILYCSTK